MDNISGKRIVITGATSGIGRCIVLELAKKGALLACCGKSDKKMEALIHEIKSIGSSLSFTKSFDLVDRTEILKFVNEAKEKLGGIDALVNCAGLNSARATVEDIKPEDLEYMMQVNMMAPLAFIQQVIKGMKQQGHGKIVNILSTVCLLMKELALIPLPRLALMPS
jgi:NADP-dependent 3-hydroxy acid dehydrogenase YdfG